jgi:S1-C subfamily serine protease
MCRSRIGFAVFVLILSTCSISAQAQEALPELAKRIKPSVVTIISTVNKKGTKKSGSGFFVGQSFSSLYPTADDVPTFAKRIKARFGEYSDLEDEDLARRILEKIPEYRTRVKFSYTIQDLAPKIIRVNDVKSGALIVTNWHVVANSKQIIIKTQDKQSYSVLRIVAYSVESDLALLQTNAPEDKYQPLELAAAFPEEGERVLVIGNPLGVLEGSLSDGIISSLRKTSKVGTILQITAPVSPGSSGSPVINMDGQVLGVVTSGLTQGQSINFAMPWITIARLLNPEDPLDLFSK